MSKVRLAVIGAGNQCTNQLMPAIPFIPEIELVAVCDLKRDLAERNARAFGALAAYMDFEKMLDEQSPDAAMVVGPPQMHEEIGIAVLEHGCHLFVEKPSSPTIEGARRLMEAAARAGKMGQVGHMMRHADPIRVAWDLVHSEEFGAILSVESKYCTGPGGVIPPGHGWGEPDGDWTYMLNQGGHPIDLLRHFLGPIVRVAGAKRSGRGNAKVYQAVVESSDGRVGFLNCQDSFRGWMTGLEVVGDGEGVVRVDDLGRLQYRRGETRTPSENGIWALSAYLWEPHHMLKAWQRSGYGNQLRRFAQCILGDAQPVPSLWDGWRNLVVGKCMTESCRTHRMVEVPQE